MPIGSLTMRAGNLTLVIIGLAIIVFGIFLSHQVSVLADNIVYQNAQTQAALAGQPFSTASVKHPTAK